METNFGPSEDGREFWEEVRKARAAGGYPWTHLQHNQEEEVWINPLKLPSDISRETVRRKDGTIPAEWFHLPEGAATPSVEELLREDSPESDIEAELLRVPPPEIQLEEQEQNTRSKTPCGRRTPSGRRTPICGKHRHRHKSSSGSSPAPSLKSQYQSSSSLKPNHQRTASQPERTDHIESQKSVTEKLDTGGYEPVGTNLLSPSPSSAKKVSRSPSSQLPTLPSQDADDSDSTITCFPLRRSRSRSKDRKLKKSQRSPSRDSGCSEHAYETPKLLQKSQTAPAPEVDRTIKPGLKKKARSDLEDGYEPVGKPPGVIEAVISQQGVYRVGEDTAIRNIEDGGGQMGVKNRIEIEKIIHKETMMEDFENYNDHLSDENVVHLQRDFQSDQNSKSAENIKDDTISKKEMKKQKAEKEKLLKEEKKRLKQLKEKEQKEEKQRQKLLKKEEKIAKEKEAKSKKEQSKPETKEITVSKEDLNNPNSPSKSKSILDTMIEKVRKLSTEDKQPPVSETYENEENKNNAANDEEKIKAIMEKEAEKRKVKIMKEEESLKKKAIEREKIEEKKRKREKEKREEKERLNLVKIEKERQAKELKELKGKKGGNTKDIELIYADDEQDIQKQSLSGSKCGEDEENPRLGSKPDQLYEPVGHTNTEPCVADTSPEETAEPAAVEADSVSTAEEMALSSRPPGEVDSKKYVSVVSSDTFNSFQQNGYHEEEDIDFTPQNGYVEPEEMDTQEAKSTAKGKKAGVPKKDLMGRIQDSIKNARLPSPGEIKDGYLNSAFHKSLHQPLMVKSKVEKTDVQKARQAMTQEKTPAQLGNIDSLSDIPVPTIRKSKGEKMETETDEEAFHFPTNMDEFGQAAYNTLPKSMREQNIVTAVKENLDPEELERNRTLTKTKTPAELAQINSLAEFPVPEKIKHLLAFERKETEPKENKKRRHSDCEPEVSEPFTMYSTLPRSLRETKLVTNVKVEEDEEKIQARQALVESKSPVELSAITSLSDLPIPSKITRMMNRAPGAASTPGSKLDISSKTSTKASSKMNVNDMYSTLPKSLTMELAVTTKVNKNQEEASRRQKLTQEKTPTELGNIGSISELPIPSALQNIFAKSDAPEKPQRKSVQEKRKRNLTTGTFLSPDFLPASWTETKLMVRTKVEEDESVLKSRQELVESKTPMELGQINGLSDLPVPTRVQTLMRSKKRVLKSTEEKEMSKKVSGSAQSLPAMSAFLTIPDSLKTELLVKSKIEDPEVVAKHQELVKTKSVSELSQIRDISDFPIPDGIENFFKQNPVKNSGEKNEKMSETVSERPTSPQSFKESIYETLPRSLRETQLVVKEVVEDQDLVKERQELTRTKSPTELSQITSLSEFPIPANVENLLKKKSEAESGPELPTPPPRKWKKEDIYESIPSSLRSELVVRSREMEDPEELEHRKELIRTQTPAQLSEIHSLSEIPVPKFIQNLGNPEKKTDEPEAEKVPFSIEKIYETLTPASLMETKLLVKTETEDPEVQAARAEIVKSKSVNELSQITSLADIPIPDAIENFVKKSYAPAERKKKFKEKVKSQSTQSLSQTMYSTLPRSLKQDLLVKSIVEDPDILAERRAVVASKSVSELSQVTSFSDIPIPSNLKRAFHKSMEMLTGFMTPKENADETDIRPITPGGRSITENMYATLPKSLKSELLVKSCVEDPEIQQERMALTQSKSVSELSQIKSLSDIPIPENIEKLISRTATNKTESPEQQSLDSRPVSRNMSVKGFKDDMYASLPRSLKDQLIVRTKVEENEEVLQQRQALVESKSPAELSEIHSLGELPIPSRIEAWLHGSNVDAERNGDEESPMTLPRTKKELTDAVYRTLPPSLTQPCIVRSKVEDPNILLERQQLQQTKSIHELSKIRNLNEMPIPGNIIKLPDVALPKVKNILNYIARPAPRTPRTPNGTKSETYHSYESAQSETVESTPLTDDKVFHSMSNGNESPTGSLIHDQELGYEVISKSPEPPQIVATPPQQFKVTEQEQMPTPPPPEAEEDHFSLAQQIKGTPERSMRGKKKNTKNRRSHEVHDDMDSSVVSESIASEEIPPPLPPKRLTPSPKKGMSLESQPSMEEEELEAIPVKNKLSTVGDVLDVPVPVAPRREKQSASVEPREITEKLTPEVEERIQSRPLPPPPAPPRTLKKKSASIEESDGRTSRSSETSYRDVHEATYTETENFRTCAETLNTSKTMKGSSNQSGVEDDVTLADSVVDSLVSCAETLVGDNDNLETCADTLTGGDLDQGEFYSDDDIDNPYPSVDFNQMMDQGPGAGAKIVEEERSGRSMVKKSEAKKGEAEVKKSESGRRLEEGTQQLSIELMEHVESLKTTLDNMSSRLGTRSRSRSQSKSRPASTFKDQM